MKNKISIGSLSELKNLVQQSIGQLNKENVAIVKDKVDTSGKFNISKSNIADFCDQIKPYLKDGNVAVVTAEEIDKPKNIENKKPKMR